MGLEERIQRLEDIDAVNRLKNEYAFWCDDGYNPEKIASLFVEDGVWANPDFADLVGPEAIADFFRAVGDAVSWAHHCQFNPVVEISADGTSATGTWNFLVLATMAGIDDPDTLEAVVVTGRYDDTFVKRDGEWKFQELSSVTYQQSNLDQGWVRQPFRGR